MSQKTLKEYLYKYLPPAQYESIMTGGVVTRSRLDKDKRCLEVFVNFENIIPKSDLYAIEAQVAKAYALNHFRIFPQYSSSLFRYEYVTEILKEAERQGVVARGFFSDYTYPIDGDKLSVKIAFPKNGVRLLEKAETPRVIEQIIMSEFSMALKVTIIHDENGDLDLSDAQKQLLEAYDKQILQAEKEYGVARPSEQTDATSSEAPEKLPRLSSVFGESNSQLVREGDLIRIGCRTFDVSAPNFAIGSEFDIAPVPISSVNRPVRNVIFVGEIFQLTKVIADVNQRFLCFY